MLNLSKQKELFSVLSSSPQRLDYSVLDNVSTEWCAPSFELFMNKDPRGLQPIGVDLHKFTQQDLDKPKQHSVPRKMRVCIFLLSVSPLRTPPLQQKKNHALLC